MTSEITTVRRPLLHAFTILALVIILSCSFKDTIADNNLILSNEMVTTKTGQNIEKILISFVTLRNKQDINSVSDIFGGERGQLQTGTCTVSFFAGLGT